MKQERQSEMAEMWIGCNSWFSQFDYFSGKIPCIWTFVYAIHINALPKENTVQDWMLHMCTLQNMLKKLGKEDGNERL